VRLWHVSTQRELIRFQTSEQDQGLFQVEFSPDGRALAARRYDTNGPITWLHYAPSFAETAVAEGGDYRILAGDDTATWLNVARALHRENRGEEALEACAEVLRRTASREELAWLADKARLVRVSVLKKLNRLAEAGTENCARLGIPVRDSATPTNAIDLSAFYNATLADAPGPEVHANDLSELPQGIQTLAETVFDVRGRLQVFGGLGQQIEGIRVGRRLARLHFLHAAGGDSHKVATGDRIGHYRIHFADGRAVEIPIRYNVDVSDHWALEHLPSELPEAVVAWRGANPRSRAKGNGDAIRLFKRTWQNPYPDVEITALDFVAENAGTHPGLVALTAE
jgi:hypothetical protein